MTKRHPEGMYAIVRYFYPSLRNAKLIKYVATEEEAREHCRREDTRKEGVYFDGYIKT